MNSSAIGNGLRSKLSIRRNIYSADCVKTDELDTIAGGIDKFVPDYPGRRVLASVTACSIVSILDVTGIVGEINLKTFVVFAFLET